ncbi:tetratricopeptide repeat protein [Roseobacter sp. YSTF-M11]|uniref:Tetratricopeptide repeat protein n=1 Tax=Roseobacter insulae TaxID=2859783 RepID=A0A9X1G104_9RHOB|nr:tetratricopeptide repeat protein [Roseobacter insulae]MBW4710573.1 tetratricopeptide repeat protein [Roseobacter insulae]
MTTAAAIAIASAMAIPVQAQSVAGPYLAARSAAMQSDFEQAASYFTQALTRDPGNAQLMESTVVSQLALGRIDRAEPVATALVASGQESQIAELVLTASAILDDDYEALIAKVPEGQGIGPLVDGLVQAWGMMGAGNVSDALSAFDGLAQEPGLQGFALYHKAMALASVGDYEGAENIFGADTSGSIMQTRRGVLARAEILSQLDRNSEALELLQRMFSGATDPEIDQIIAALNANEPVPFRHVTSVRDGFAEVFYSVAAALRSEAGPEYTILYAQVARALRPDHVDALLLTAELFETLGQHGLAIGVYKGVPSDHPAYHAAELGRAAAMRRSGKPEAAIEVLEQLARTHGGLVSVQAALGDALRQEDRFAEAVAAYDRAVTLSEDNGGASWFLLYARAIANERQGNWEAAEAGFRSALEVNPGQPQVLNYLGYSLVEKQENLDEALDMIERAVAASPDSGYIIDSLGWALYRLGRYDEAVPHMERAVELMAVDPVVNDHLGDVYWAVGRKREAEFQWARALSFVDEEDPLSEAKPDRIRRKLEIGLDAVLAEEGAEPLEVARD